MNAVKQNFKNIAEKIISNEDLISCYKELSVIFKNSRMYQEQAGCLERIAHITKEPYLYEQIGDIFKDDLNNYQAAFAAYTKYLSLTQPKFYKKYSETSEHPFSVINLLPYNDNFIQLTDKYIIILYMHVYFYKMEIYDGILEFEKYIDTINSEINYKLGKISIKNKDLLEDTKDAECHLSSLLSEKTENTELNYLAVKLNSGNELAHLNIIYNFLRNNEFDKALKHFNSDYAKKFQLNKISDEKQLLWLIASKYLEHKKPFEAVNCEKQVIDMELKTYEK